MRFDIIQVTVLLFIFRSKKLVDLVNSTVIKMSNDTTMMTYQNVIGPEIIIHILILKAIVNRISGISTTSSASGSASPSRLPDGAFD